MESKQKILSIEGNIGAGKTTLLSLIQNNIKNTQILREPVCQWQAINGDPNLNLLNLFYSDPKRWAYTFQSYSLYCRLRSWNEFRLEQPFAIAERSVLSDKYIFAVNGYKEKLISQIEWEIYNQYFEFLAGELGADKLDGIIYIKTNPEICGERIMKRGREEEKDSIPLSYLQSLHDRHEEWLIQSNEKHQPVLILDGNIDYDYYPDQQNKIIEQVQDFLTKI